MILQCPNHIIKEYHVSFCNRTSELQLSRVKKEFGKPHEDLAKLKKSLENSVAQHTSKLLAAKDFIYESASNTNNTNNLLVIIQNNIEDFSVSFVSLM